MIELIYNVSLRVSKKRWLALALILMLSSTCGLAQSYSNDSCVLVSKSRMLNSGISKVYTHTIAPVKSITSDNKKWIFDTTGRLTKELHFNLTDSTVIDEIKMVEYYQTRGIKSVSIFRKTRPDEKNPPLVIRQELYNWFNDSLTIIELNASDTVRRTLEVVNENGCVKFSRAEFGTYVTETNYEYNSQGYQIAKFFKQWDNYVLSKGFETKLHYKNDILSSKKSIDLLSGEMKVINYHLDSGKLKGYLLDLSTMNDSSHIISYSEMGDIVFQQYDDRTYSVVEFTEGGSNCEDKIFTHDDGIQKIDRYKISKNGDVAIISLENHILKRRITKKLIKDEHGNWIKMTTLKQEINKPTIEKVIQREIEYY